MLLVTRGAAASVGGDGHARDAPVSVVDEGRRRKRPRPWERDARDTAKRVEGLQSLPSCRRGEMPVSRGRSRSRSEELLPRFGLPVDCKEVGDRAWSQGAPRRCPIACALVGKPGRCRSSQCAHVRIEHPKLRVCCLLSERRGGPSGVTVVQSSPLLSLESLVAPLGAMMFRSLVPLLSWRS